MHRHRSFVIALASTVAVIVPAAWRGLDATIEKDGRRVRALQQSFTVDGVRVTLDVDHSLIANGDSVVAKLRAFSDTPKQIAVDLAVLHSDDAIGSRVAAPPQSIDKEHLTLQAAPDGGKPVETKLVLGAGGGGNKVDWYRVIAMPRGSKVDSMGEVSDREGNYDQGNAAAVGVLAWGANDFDLSIEPQGPITSGAPFTVVVRVKNTTGHTLRHSPYVSLGTSIGLYAIEQSPDFKVDEPGSDEPELNSDDMRKWKRGSVETHKFVVTPARKDLKTVTFVASAYVWQDEPGPISQGAMDAETFAVKPAAVEEPAKPTVAAN